jgi:hypothetical protein
VNEHAYFIIYPFLFVAPGDISRPHNEDIRPPPISTFMATPFPPSAATLCGSLRVPCGVPRSPLPGSSFSRRRCRSRGPHGNSSKAEHVSRSIQMRHSVERLLLSFSHVDRSGEAFRMLIWLRRAKDFRPRAQKIRRLSSGGGTVDGDFLVREIALPHIDHYGSRHLAVSNGRLPDPVSRNRS